MLLTPTSCWVLGINVPAWPSQSCHPFSPPRDSGFRSFFNFKERNEEMFFIFNLLKFKLYREVYEIYFHTYIYIYTHTHKSAILCKIFLERIMSCLSRCFRRYKAGSRFSTWYICDWLSHSRDPMVFNRLITFEFYFVYTSILSLSSYFLNKSKYNSIVNCYDAP